MKYRADIDGLRAIAVVPVVLFHAGVTSVSGGFVGVDVFFVISGYLITSMISNEIRNGRFSISRFYERRIRRIFPALFAMVAASSIAAWFLLPPFDFTDYGRSTIATSAFASNVLFWFQSGYFEAPAHLKPLLHTWSLAVEEQFYIVFPILLFLLHRWRRGKEVAVLFALFVVSLVACVWMTQRDISMAFYLAPFRGWELLIGCVLALGGVPDTRRVWVREAAAGIGLLLIGWSVVTFSEATTFPGIRALAPCLGAGLVIYAGAQGSTVIGRVLASAPVVFIGKISYSLYLWHWPWLIFAGFYVVHPLTAMQTAIVVALALVTSVLSWRFVEQPVRRTTMARAKIFAYAAIATAGVIGFGAATQITHGFASRMSKEARTFDAARNDRSPDRERCHATDARPIPFAKKCIYGPGKAPTVAIWGDSFAAELGYELGKVAPTHGDQLLYVSFTACGPAVGVFGDDPRCDKHNEEVLRQLLASTSIAKVVLVARYEAYPPRMGNAFLGGFARVATQLAAAGKHVVVVYPIPTPPGHVPSILARLSLLGGDLAEAEIDRGKFERDNRDASAMLDKLVQQPGITGAHPANVLCDSSRCSVLGEGRALYFDVDHLSLAGARLVLPELGLYPR